MYQKVAVGLLGAELDYILLVVRWSEETVLISLFFLFSL